MAFKSTIVLMAALAVASLPTSAVATSKIWLSYPKHALAAGEEGKVGITVTVGSDGRVKTCVVIKSSGFKDLDEATCDQFVKYAYFDPHDKGFPKDGTFSTSVNWHLGP